MRTASVGHLRDVRRLVVACSRARLGLYVDHLHTALPSPPPAPLLFLLPQALLCALTCLHARAMLVASSESSCVRLLSSPHARICN